MGKVVKSICQMCQTAYGGCGIDVHIKNGKILKIEGTKGHPVNDGKLCAKGLSAIQLEYDTHRLQYPMKRVGKKGDSRWQRISWDEAMDTIAAKLKDIIRTDGPQAIAYLKGQAPGWESNWDFCQRFMNTIGSPNLATPGHNCHIARVIGHIFTYGGLPDSDFDNTQCMLLWGSNPFNISASNIAIRIMKAKQRGAKLIVVDPRLSRTAAKADIHLRPRPGSDGALALGMLNVIIKENLYDKEFVNKWAYGFDRLAELVNQYPPEKVAEITWVPADAIREVARAYATTKPAALHEANGIDQHSNVTQTARAIAILRVITGNLDVPGGNVMNPEAAPFFKRTADMSLRKMSPQDIEEAFRNSVSNTILKFRLEYCNLPQIIDAILTQKPYPIKAAIVQGINPVIVESNASRIREALQKLDLLVVFDIFMSATAELADIVLPAATFLERTLLVKWRGNAKPKLDTPCYQLAPKVIESLGECKSDYDFIASLTRSIGHEEAFPWKGIEGAIDYELSPIGLSYEYLEEHPGPEFGRKYPPEEMYRKYAKFLSLPMLPGKAALYSEALERLGYDPLPTYKEPGESPASRPDLAKEYPLICTAGLKPVLYTHSQFHSLPWLREIMPEPWIEMHPQKADELGIQDGDMVVVTSPRGSIEIRCRAVNTVDPRVVAIAFGWGDPYAGSQPIVNVLSPHDIRCPISGATSNRCFLVKVTRRA